MSSLTPGVAVGQGVGDLEEAGERDAVGLELAARLEVHLRQDFRVCNGSESN